MYTIIPTCGLGNRLRCIASAVKLSQFIATKPICLWIPNKDLNCRFEDIFEPIPIVKECGKWFQRYVFRCFRFLKKTLKNCERFDVLTDYENKRLTDIVGYDIASGEVARLVIAESFSEFLNTGDVDYRSIFRPSVQVLNLLLHITSKFPLSCMIGLHIRRTDNKESIRLSPIEAFESRIRQEISHDPKAHFYLATDDEATAVHLCTQFGNHIVTSHGVKKRDTKEGILQATAELFALSSCKYIIGSYYSSFSQLAARLGHCPLEIINSAGARVF